MMTLKGNKTYITAVVMALASFAVGMDWLTQTQYQVIIGLLGALGLSALRSGVTESEKDTAKVIKDESAPCPDVPSGAMGPTGT